MDLAPLRQRASTQNDRAQDSEVDRPSDSSCPGNEVVALRRSTRPQRRRRPTRRHPAPFFALSCMPPVRGGPHSSQVTVLRHRTPSTMRAPPGLSYHIAYLRTLRIPQKGTSRTASGCGAPSEPTNALYTAHAGLLSRPPTRPPPPQGFPRAPHGRRAAG